MLVTAAIVTAGYAGLTFVMDERDDGLTAYSYGEPWSIAELREEFQRRGLTITMSAPPKLVEQIPFDDLGFVPDLGGPAAIARFDHGEDFAFIYAWRDAVARERAWRSPEGERWNRVTEQAYLEVENVVVHTPVFAVGKPPDDEPSIRRALADMERNWEPLPEDERQ